MDTVADLRFDSFAEGLRRLRMNRLMTQEELAERAEISVRAVRNAETGRARRPHRGTIERLARALELPTEVRDKMVACGRAKASEAVGCVDMQGAGNREAAIVHLQPGEALVVVINSSDDVNQSTITFHVSATTAGS